MSTPDRSGMDSALIVVAWTSTALIASVSYSIRQRPELVNAVFGVAISVAAIVFSIIIGRALWELPVLLFERIFDGTYRRICLLLFWTMCVVASMGFCLLVSLSERPATTTHRKFFHLTVTLIAVSGLYYDPKFLFLSAHLTLIAFILIELMRSLEVPPWSAQLNRWLLAFLDEQDSAELVLTPILLLVGVFMPVYVFPVDQETLAPQAWHFAGVLTVGIGDAFAALVGSRFGRTRWPWAPARKSVEGSLAMFAAQAVAVPLLGLPASFGTLCAVLGSTLVEAHLTWGDNVVPPAMAMLCLRYLP